MSNDDDVLRTITHLLNRGGGGGRTIYEYEKANSRARIYKTKPWARGRVGSIERQILYLLPSDGKPMTTGELARHIYDHPLLRPKGAPPRKLKSWEYLQVRKSAHLFADCVGRSGTGRGRPYLYRIKYNDSRSFDEIRKERAAKRRQRAQGAVMRKVKAAPGM